MIYWGLLRRKETLALSWRGWLLFLLITFTALLIIARYVHPFLGISRPTYGEILVVEGWVTDTVLEQAVSFFNKHDYQLIVTVGGPLIKGSYLSDYSTYAELSAATLIQLGVKQSLIVTVPAPYVRTDRTFASALAVNDWLSQSNMPIKSMDVFSMGAHARRTQWLFQRALGDKILVGVVGAPHPEYDANSWWTSSSGVRSVIGEAIAFLYARFVFNPQESSVAQAD